MLKKSNKNINMSDQVENMTKTIGLLGGMSWESTTEYYKAINSGVKSALGGLHSARIAMISVDFAPIEAMLAQGDWDRIAVELSRNAQQIEAAGADFLLICTNTMHKVAPQISEAVNIPLLHIADAAALELAKHGVRTVGLIGTAATMEDNFYKGRLEDEHGLTVLVPEPDDRQLVHQVIFDELCLGKIKTSSKQEYLRIIDALSRKGAQAVILGCTEIGMLVSDTDTSIPLFDTTAIHAAMAVESALTDGHEG